MTDDDREDRAIARAFDIDADDTAPVDSAAVNRYREVTAHLAGDVTPPPGLEDRMVAAARNVRDAATTAIDAAPSARRRRSGTRYAIVAAGSAVAAAIVIAVFIVGSGTTATNPSGRVDPIAASRADVAAVAAQPGARTGTLSNAAGNVVLAADGSGYVYNLSAPHVSLWVDAADGTTHLGDAEPQNGIVPFKVNHPDAVRVVRVASPGGAELGRATLTN